MFLSENIRLFWFGWREKGMLKNDLLFSHDTVSFIWYMVRMNFTGNF